MAVNARTEILAQALGSRPGECSTIGCVRRKPVRPLVFRPGTGTGAGPVLASARRAGHHACVRRPPNLACSADRGSQRGPRAAFFSILGHRDDARRVFPVHVLAAAVLGTAGSVAEALEVRGKTPIRTSSAFTLLDPTAAVCAELSPRRSHRAVIAQGLPATSHFWTLATRRSEGNRTLRPGFRERCSSSRPGCALPDTRAGRRPDPYLRSIPASRNCAAHAPDAVFGQRWATLATVLLEPSTAGPASGGHAVAGGTATGTPWRPRRWLPDDDALPGRTDLHRDTTGMGRIPCGLGIGAGVQAPVTPRRPTRCRHHPHGPNSTAPWCYRASSTPTPTHGYRWGRRSTVDLFDAVDASPTSRTGCSAAAASRRIRPHRGSWAAVGATPSAGGPCRDRHMLDAAVADRPVYLASNDVHSAWSEHRGAARTRHRRRHSPTPSAARSNATPTAMPPECCTRRRHWGLMRTFLDSTVTDDERDAALAADAFTHYLAAGVTGAVDMGLGNCRSVRARTRAGHDDGTLPLRIAGHWLVNRTASTADNVAGAWAWPSWPTRARRGCVSQASRSSSTV